jgi:flagellar basal-body rod protein FlgG
MALIALNSGASAMSALNTRLDVIANNLANMNTDGFKSSRVNFQDLMYQERAHPGVENANGDQRPTGLYVGLGVKTSGTQLTFQQGSPVVTKNDLDLMIDGRGFFQVSVAPDQAEGGIAYTRAGNFTLNADGEIVLATDQGRRLEPNITVPDDATKVQVTADGQVLAFFEGESDPQNLGELEIAAFVNPAGLRQMGENLFAETAASGPPIAGVPGETGLGTLQQGVLEGSNVDPTLELISLIRTQRAYEMNSQTIRAADEVMRQVAQLGR